ncbi:DUF2637 domain-containing protein [Nocardiopsis kunsanensis]|uniref:DUF2637 domain-containing protein n=1 Tax=Nocardiopsis kunsanensis TaxID=141693 RepID=UPI00034675DD|nr:DUF2637 domain-containing protein [Nocardiopsis kunsanensis]
MNNATPATTVPLSITPGVLPTGDVLRTYDIPVTDDYTHHLVVVAHDVTLDRVVEISEHLNGPVRSLLLDALDGDQPADLGRLVAAGWAPVALLLVAELVVRARQNGPWWIAALRWAGTGVVAAVAAIVSYGHMRDLLLSYGETALVAHLLPLSVDGLLLVASLALASPDDTQQRHEDVEEVVEEGLDDTHARHDHVEETAEEEPDGARAAPALAAPVPVLAARNTHEAVTVPVGDNHDHDGEETDERARARNTYRAALAEGVALNGKALAARYGRSASWGRTRIRECRTM